MQTLDLFVDLSWRNADVLDAQRIGNVKRRLATGVTCRRLIGGRRVPPARLMESRGG